jgi:hypothetical protein
MRAKHHVKRPPPVCLVSAYLIFKISLNTLVIYATGYAFLRALVEPPRQACGVSTKRYLPKESSPFAPITNCILAIFIFSEGEPSHFFLFE